MLKRKEKGEIELQENDLKRIEMLLSRFVYRSGTVIARERAPRPNERVRELRPTLLGKKDYLTLSP